MAKIRILLADDHTLFRQGIRTLLAAEQDIEIEATDLVITGVQAIAQSRRAVRGWRRTRIVRRGA